MAVQCISRESHNIEVFFKINYRRSYSIKLVIGINVSSEKTGICFLTDENQLSILYELSVARDISGTSFTRETILGVDENNLFDQVMIDIESILM